MEHKHVCLLSGGHSSALAALAVVKRFGIQNVILLNHNINNKKENADIKRFKLEISAYCQIPISYANYKNIQDDSLIPNQFELSIREKQVTTPKGDHICTSRLKTKPFLKFLADNFPDKNCTVYYGFDKKEGKRILRRSTYLAAMGYKTGFPVALWEKKYLPYTSTLQIGIQPPNTYEIWEHANCIGCLKAGLLHWYCVYMTDFETYKEGIEMENVCNFTIHTITIEGVKTKLTLHELMPIFCQLKTWGVKPNEHQNKYKFGRWLAKIGVAETQMFKPCDCVV